MAAELRKLREPRKAGEIARAIGWSPTKISRAESGHESLPPTEIEKLIDFYEVSEPLRGRLLGLAQDAAQRGWWEDHADILAPEYVEFIGLEDEAAASSHWQPDLVPGLLQTEDYARQLDIAYQRVDPTIPPSVQERMLEVRMRRQERLTREPVLSLSVVMDESVLLRRIGGNRDVMRAQLQHLVTAAELPNIDLRVLPLDRHPGLVSSSFVIMKFGAQGATAGLSDVVSTEALTTEFHVEGERETRLYSNFFNSLQRSALSQDESRQLIIDVTVRE